MNLLLTFMELDKLYESVERLDRDSLIKKIKDLGKEYNFEKYSDEQLFRVWERIKKEAEEAAALKDYHSIISAGQEELICPECGVALSDGGMCPICDDGEEDFYEWLDARGNQAKLQRCLNTTTANISTNSSVKANTNIVTIVYDSNKHKLRAQADDGVHGKGYVAFPNNLRTTVGQQYEVEALIWNGRNYRVSGNIKSI